MAKQKENGRRKKQREPSERKERSPGWPIDPGLRAAIVKNISRPGAVTKAEIGRVIGVTGQRLSQILGGGSKSIPELPTVLKMLGMPMSMLPGLQPDEMRVIDLLHRVPANLRREWIAMAESFANAMIKRDESGVPVDTKLAPGTGDAWLPRSGKH